MNSLGDGGGGDDGGGGGKNLTLSVNHDAHQISALIRIEIRNHRVVQIEKCSSPRNLTCKQRRLSHQRARLV